MQVQQGKNKNMANQTDSVEVHITNIFYTLILIENKLSGI